MTDSDDDEYARYLAEYLADNYFQFVRPNSFVSGIDREVIESLIKEFRNSLP